MSVVIRPAPAVFRKATPVLIVFGAHRSFDAQPYAIGTPWRQLASLVSEARRYRVSLGFARLSGPGGAAPDGRWAEGCRPRVRDMVFDHPAPSCFSNPAFGPALASAGQAGLCFAGPPGDSSLEATLGHCAALGIEVMRVDPDGALQKSSTPHGLDITPDPFPYSAGSGLITTYSSWVRTLRKVDNAE